MFPLDEFLKGLDKMYADKEAGKAEEYLIKGLWEAAQSKDEGAALTILNELIGYYRVFNKYDQCDSCSRQALALARKMGLKGSVDYGTTLLNAATGYRAAGRLEEALSHYMETLAIYQKHLPAEDYRLASLYNNIGILYEEMGELDKSLEALLYALEQVSSRGGRKAEQATTHTNLALLYFRRKDDKEAGGHIQKALELFGEMEGEGDPHYGAALAGLGEAYCRMGNYKEGASAYERALKEIEAYYGHNDYYKVTSGNLIKAKTLAGIL